MNLDYAGLFRALAPETAIVVGALAVLGVDLTLLRGRSLATRMNVAALISALSVLVAFMLNGTCPCGRCWVGASGPVFGGALMFDSLANATRGGILGLVLLTIGVSTGARINRNPAEYLSILLFATVGFLLMAAAQQLLVAFLSLELASLSLYILAGFDKTRPDSAEAGLKYFLFGGMSAAFLLFGFSLLYGLTGSIELNHVADGLRHQGISPLLIVALVMVIVAFGFKAAAAPFHLWAPDAYQGAPTPSAALIASASKLAGIVFFARLLWSGLGFSAGNVSYAFTSVGWLPIVAVLSGVSMFVGNLAALAQTNVRRLLAYSAISHAGILLLGLIAVSRNGTSPIFYYATTYGIATAGAFGVIGVLERQGGCDSISDLAGLYRRSPLLAGCLMVFILSLAGVPPLAGFFGKFYVFAATLKLAGLAGVAGWLTILAILFSAVALYYYMVVLKQALVVAPAKDATPVRVPIAAAVTLVLAAIAIVAFGIWPSVLLGAV
ncbi:NADPH-quinone oxidoreductase [Opitutaceae bacterium EW11]|nr:NADPH-quinone oxidoreductase [Opitutaceae bacterium EW11]